LAWDLCVPALKVLHPGKQPQVKGNDCHPLPFPKLIKQFFESLAVKKEVLTSKHPHFLPQFFSSECRKAFRFRKQFQYFAQSINNSSTMTVSPSHTQFIWEA
jgi:hypothetical protein